MCPRSALTSTTPGCLWPLWLSDHKRLVLPGLGPPLGPANTGGPGCRPSRALCSPISVLSCRFLVSGVCEPLCSFLSALFLGPPGRPSSGHSLRRARSVIPTGRRKSPLHPGSAVSPGKQPLSTSRSTLLQGAPRKPGVTIWVTRNTKHLNTFYEIPQRSKTKTVKKKKN